MLFIVVVEYININNEDWFDRFVETIELLLLFRVIKKSIRNFLSIIYNLRFGKLDDSALGRARFSYLRMSSREQVIELKHSMNGLFHLIIIEIL